MTPLKNAPARQREEAPLPTLGCPTIKTARVQTCKSGTEVTIHESPAATLPEQAAQTPQKDPCTHTLGLFNLLTAQQIEDKFAQWFSGPGEPLTDEALDGLKREIASGLPG